MAEPERPAADEIAPDGTAIRRLALLPGASVVRCTLPAGRVARAVAHRTVHEAWVVLSGRGEIWLGGTVVELVPGADVVIPPGAPFQLRAGDGADLVAVVVTSPPWPGEDEAVSSEGPWRATI